LCKNGFANYKVKYLDSDFEIDSNDSDFSYNKIILANDENVGAPS